ncbi:hypothetical protein [Bradyrhizobium sp.]|uniref:hypothetical protein n=1 Tax=Bradyrhizobium sp. TaxID=376 RepID=UPI003C6ED555
MRLQVFSKTGVLTLITGACVAGTRNFVAIISGSGFAPSGAPRNDEGTKCQKYNTSSSAGMWGVPELDKKNTPIVRPSAGREAISAVKMSEKLTAEVDAWAEAHDTVRSDAIRRLIELGLNVRLVSRGPVSYDPLAIEDLAVHQLDHLLDPSLPSAERERRIRRLTEGPPEFSDERIDLPKARK